MCLSPQLQSGYLLHSRKPNKLLPASDSDSHEDVAAFWLTRKSEPKHFDFVRELLHVERCPTKRSRLASAVFNPHYEPTLSVPDISSAQEEVHPYPHSKWVLLPVLAWRKRVLP